jgi:hypothetical protein
VAAQRQTAHQVAHVPDLDGGEAADRQPLPVGAEREAKNLSPFPGAGIHFVGQRGAEHLAAGRIDKVDEALGAVIDEGQPLAVRAVREDGGEAEQHGFDRDFPKLSAGVQVQYADRRGFGPYGQAAAVRAEVRRESLGRDLVALFRPR